MRAACLIAAVAALGVVTVAPAEAAKKPPRTKKKTAKKKATTRGPAGPRGAAGPAGPIGPAGPAGPAGPVGPAGAPGAAGERGPAGSAGTNGANGSNGSNGSDGAQGPQGSTGPRGATGPTGPSSAVTILKNRSFTVGSDSTIVHCPLGQIATGGGGQRGNATDVRLAESYPDPPVNSGVNPSGWNVTYDDPTPGDGSYVAWVVCTPGS